MNILILYYEPAISGQSTHVLSLVKGLIQKGHRVTVILPEKIGELAREYQTLGAQTYVLPFGKILWYPKAIGILYKICQEKHQVVHVHSQEAGVTGRFLAFLFGARRIFYTPQTIDIRNKKLVTAYRWSEALLSRITYAIISVSERDRKRLVDWGIKPRKVVTIPNGIDPENQPGVDPISLRRQLGVPDQSPLVMQVSRLSDQKAPWVFVLGARRVLRDLPEARFVILGSGPLHSQVVEMAQEANRDFPTPRVIVAGWKEDARRWMAAADVVTLTSDWEGFPFTLLEAMSWAKPIVTTAVNGCNELVLDGQTGFLVPPGQINRWAERVRWLLEQPSQARQMGQSGKQVLKSRFNAQTMIDQIEALYQGS